MNKKGRITPHMRATITIVVIAVIITFAICYFIFKIQPDQQHNSNIQQYKKAFYDQIQCGYSCPITNQTVNNVSQLLPDATCIKNCQTAFANTVKPLGMPTNQELSGDNFITDLSTLASTCQQSSVVEVKSGNMTIPQPDSKAYVACVKSGLEPIKAKYSYLN